MTIKRLIPSLTLILALCGQLTIVPYFTIGRVHADFLLIIVVAWVILRGLEDGLFLAFIGGMGLDFTSGAAFGIFTLALVGVAIATHVIHLQLFGPNSYLIPAILIIPMNGLFYAIAFLMLSLLGHPLDWRDTMLLIIIPTTFINGVWMALLYIPLYWLNNLLEPPLYRSRL